MDARPLVRILSRLQHDALLQSMGKATSGLSTGEVYSVANGARFAFYGLQSRVNDYSLYSIFRTPYSQGSLLSIFVRGYVTGYLGRSRAAIVNNTSTSARGGSTTTFFSNILSRLASAMNYNVGEVSFFIQRLHSPYYADRFSRYDLYTFSSTVLASRQLTGEPHGLCILYFSIRSYSGNFRNSLSAIYR